jgi:15-cis-phytoene synthase
MDLSAAYTECARITRREARNFYVAFFSLPKPQRQSVYALYAFCREADDAVDSCAGRDPQAALTGLRRRLDQAAGGQPIADRDHALADTIARYDVEPQHLHDVLTGMEMDLTISRINDETMLDRYCYHVASAVGLATLPILNRGVPPTDRMQRDAIRLGKGMQCVNILRDVAEDLTRGRIYLPATVLQKYEVRENILHERTLTDPLRSALAWLADRAQGDLQEGRGLVPQLPRRSRSCPWLLAEIYGRILQQIATRGFDVFSGRASLPAHQKLWLLTSTLWRRL